MLATSLLLLIPINPNQATGAEGLPAASTNQESARLAQLGSCGVRAHDPSTIVTCKDQYWVFCTGPGILSYHSKDRVTWEPGPRIFTNAPPWVAEAVPENRRTYFWAPDIVQTGGRYLVYYSVSSFGKNTSAIGLVTNPTLDPNDPQYRWTDRGIVVQSRAEDSYNTIDPAVATDAQGGLWLAFGSFWSGIKLIQLDPASGKRIEPNSPMYALAHSSAIEAPCLCRHGDYYYLFVNWGICCRGTNSTYNIRVGRSAAITGPYRDKDGVDLLQGGGSLLLETSGQFIGPGHAGIFAEKGADWLSCHFYDGTRSGLPTLVILPLHWGGNGWPEVEMPAPK